MRLVIEVSLEEYKIWLDALPDDMSFASKEFGDSDIEIDPLATFMKDQFELFGYSWFENKRPQFRTINCEWGMELTFSLPEWTIPFICLYHGRARIISKNDAIYDYGIAQSLLDTEISAYVDMAERKIDKYAYLSESEEDPDNILRTHPFTLLRLIGRMTYAMHQKETRKAMRKKRNEHTN